MEGGGGSTRLTQVAVPTLNAYVNGIGPTKQVVIYDNDPDPEPGAGSRPWSGMSSGM